MLEKKNMSKLEVKQKLIKYLTKKGLNVELDIDEKIYWNYNVHYSTLKIKLDPEKDNYDDDFFIIRYLTSIQLDGLYKKKTSTKNNFCLAVYNNLLLIKEQFDKIAEYKKIETDLKNKYCNELEAYYKRKYDKVGITTKQTDDYVDISINCDYGEYYNIIYKDNKYYLKSKSIYFDKQIEI